MVLFSVTKIDAVNVSDRFQRTVALHKTFTEVIRIAEIRFSGPVTIAISEAVRLPEEMASEIKVLLRYLGLNLGRWGIRIRQVRDEASTEV